jgi:glycosyltransferase involved in cell wall biosynthesis
MRLAFPIDPQAKHGWGVFGNYLSRELSKLEILPDYLTLHAITGPTFQPLLPDMWGKRNVGLCFIEDTAEAIHHIEKAKRYDAVLAGSTWNAEWLRSKGVNAYPFIQGVDHEYFYYRKREKSNKFVVFSGGKAEYRKGTDIVIRVMAEMMRKYPEVHLSCSWEHPWLKNQGTLDQSKLIQYKPMDTCHETYAATLEANGVPLDRVTLWPGIRHQYMAGVYEESDIGLFPNRCEAGTNMVLMEYLAVGRPAIYTYDHGHADLPMHGHKWSINSASVSAGWCETNMYHALDLMELAYRHWKNDAMPDGRANSHSMERFTWDKCARSIHDVCKTALISEVSSAA